MSKGGTELLFLPLLKTWVQQSIHFRKVLELVSSSSFEAFSIAVYSFGQLVTTRRRKEKSEMNNNCEKNIYGNNSYRFKRGYMVHTQYMQHTAAGNRRHNTKTQTWRESDTDLIVCIVCTGKTQ